MVFKHLQIALRKNNTFQYFNHFKDTLTAFFGVLLRNLYQ